MDVLENTQDLEVQAQTLRTMIDEEHNSYESGTAIFDQIVTRFVAISSHFIKDMQDLELEIYNSRKTVTSDPNLNSWSKEYNLQLK